MGLDITFKQKERILCPKCGELAGYREANDADTGGRAWYPFLESIGYYVPNSEENEWYGKDMILTEEQASQAFKFAIENEVYNWREVTGLISYGLARRFDIAINADW